MQTIKYFKPTARALVVQNNCLLFVSDEGEYWYLPGGGLELSETLHECVEREVYEETGLSVKAGFLRHVLECFDVKDQRHKIHCYFQVTLLKGTLSDQWCDEGGSVKFRRYFSLEEIKQNPKILPRFLANGEWNSETPEISAVYKGSVMMRGFELLQDNA